MKNIKFWLICLASFVLWKIIFSTDFAKDGLKEIVKPNPSPAIQLEPQEHDRANLIQIHPEPIPNNAGASAITKGISPDGKLTLQIVNDTKNWEVRDVIATLTNAQQQADYLNGHRSTPAYTEKYQTQVSIKAGSVHSIELQTNWNYNENYLVNIDMLGYHLD